MREELIEALKKLARGDVNAAEAVVDLFMPRVADPRDVVEVPFPTAEDVDAMKAMNTPDKRKAKQ